MIERLLENWLTNTNERAYMIPYCQLLISKGYTILYISQHGMEEAGKDIIARNSKGKVEAFQLKTGDIGLSEFRSIYGELEELLKHPIQHPSIKDTEKYKSYLVASGRIKDPIRTRITELNRTNWGQKKVTKLEYIDRERLLVDLIGEYGKFIPSELQDFKSFLEFYLANGSEMFLKEKFSVFLNKYFNFSTPVTPTQAQRLIASSILITSYCINPWMLKNNYIAQIEAWVLLLSHILALISKYKIDSKYWEHSIKLIETAVDDLFKSLLIEVKERSHYIEGDWTSEGLVYPAKVSMVLGYICAYANYKTLKKESLSIEIEKEIIDICSKFEDKMQFFGESCFPLFLSYYWFNEKHGRFISVVTRLAELLRSIIDEKVTPQPYGWPNPYYDIEKSLRVLTGFEKPNEHFFGQPYSLMSLIEILTRRNARRFLTLIWRKISHVQYLEFVPDNIWQFFLWRSDEGTLVSLFPEKTQSWGKLREKSFNIDYEKIPEILKQNPHLALLITMIMPQRFTVEIVRLLDNSLTPSLFDHFKNNNVPTSS